jgi:hypothetical protein
MLGVAAMAVQNALSGAPSTAVMTTNVTVFTMDLREILLAQDALPRRVSAPDTPGWRSPAS